MKKYLFLLILGVMLLTSCTITIDVDSLEELQYYKKYDQEVFPGEYNYYTPYTLKSISYVEIRIDIDDYNNDYYPEMMLMTRYNFDRFKNGYSFNAYHRDIEDNGDTYWRIEGVQPGDYVLVIDNSERGWAYYPPSYLFWQRESFNYDFTLKINKMYQ